MTCNCSRFPNLRKNGKMRGRNIWKVVYWEFFYKFSIIAAYERINFPFYVSMLDEKLDNLNKGINYKMNKIIDKAA